VLLVDSAAAAGGGAFGVSSVTTYVESGAGVGEGARTGLAAVVTGLLFALAIFFVPLNRPRGPGRSPRAEEQFIHPAIAPALVMVGALMIRLVAGIDWSRSEEAIPPSDHRGIPLTFSIAAGIGSASSATSSSWPSLGRAREVHVLMWFLVPLFLAFYAEDWLQRERLLGGTPSTVTSARRARSMTPRAGLEPHGLPGQRARANEPNGWT
jgi:AGZA family xanthine/uracil permease-like MFS transporter